LEKRQRVERKSLERKVKLPPVYIKEVILENFMSYEYARVPLVRGINVICGPNGAGKSSILLGISVALGQAYTERSRRLSDLIRRGKDTARVTLIFDNEPVNGKRPIPFSRSNTFMLSRYLKSDGSYWFEADFREISKAEVVRALRELGINPDNMLIIMHQGMVEEFTVKTPQEKLKMVEEAVGFEAYRERLIEAEERLRRLADEEKSLSELAGKAEETLGYWKEIYERYLEKRRLEKEIERLKVELYWSNVIKKERGILTLKERLQAREKAREGFEKRLKDTKMRLEEARKELSSQRVEVRKLYFALVRLERERGLVEAKAKVSADFTKLLNRIKQLYDKVLDKVVRDEKSFNALKEGLQSIKGLENEAKVERQGIELRIKDLSNEVKSLQVEIDKSEQKLISLIERFSSLRADEALLSYRIKELVKEINEIKRDIRKEEQELRDLLLQAEGFGKRIETKRTPNEILDEIKLTNAKIQAIGEIPEDAEKIYNEFTSSYEELKDKLKQVIENKNLALKEVEERKKVWKEAIYKLLKRITPIYKKVLASVNAIGDVRFINPDNVEQAGLELLVGFRGSKAVELNPYTQSGGERSVSVMAFLLALQQSILSPIRAVDEFDVHMDPLNREAIFNMIFSQVKNIGCQYIVITPSQLTSLDTSANLIVVQSVGGVSKVMVHEAKA
jgi:chromosome segregation ATPase